MIKTAQLNVTLKLMRIKNNISDDTATSISNELKSPENDNGLLMLMTASPLIIWQNLAKMPEEKMPNIPFY